MSTRDTVVELPGARSVSREQADRLLSLIASIRRSGRRQAARPAELGTLTGAQLELVRLVRRRPGISVTEAARELLLAANTVSTLVGQLVRLGLMERRVDGADRRIARLELAADLSEKVAGWRDRRVEALGEAIALLPAGERGRMADALNVLALVAAGLEEAGSA